MIYIYGYECPDLLGLGCVLPVETSMVKLDLVEINGKPHEVYKVLHAQWAQRAWVYGEHPCAGEPWVDELGMRVIRICLELPQVHDHACRTLARLIGLEVRTNESAPLWRLDIHDPGDIGTVWLLRSSRGAVAIVQSEESGEEARFTGLYDRYVVIPQIAGSTCCAVALRTALMSACGTASTSPRYATKPPEVPCLSEGQHRSCLQCEETDTCPLINWEKIG